MAENFWGWNAVKERLQKILSQRGVCSRRAAEQLIAQGRVTCNGVVAGLGDTADVRTDTILVDGKPLPPPAQYAYIMLHKPRGYVTTLSDEKGRKNVSELVQDCGLRVYPVGRLDMDSEGLLLLTNDGAFANAWMHPRHEVDKVYHVWVQGFCEESLSLLERRVELDGYRIQQPQVRLIRRDAQRAVIAVTIHEGRNRQVRRMCAMANLKVTRLKRVQEGSLFLGDLPLGKWRYLTRQEMQSMK